MPTGNGITVRVKDANGDSLEEAGPSSEEPRQFRCRLIAATPGTRFEITVIVEKRFAWQGADTLFIAIAYDDGLEEHLGGTDFTMAWAIPNREDCLGEHTFTKATKHGSDSAALLKTTYSMPDAVAAVKNINPDHFRHRSKDALVSHRGCISVYVHRGHLSLNPTKRRPAEPVAQSLTKALPGIDKSSQRKFKINFESFEPLYPKHGNVCEFHFRNVNPEEFERLMAAAPYKPKAKEARSATPTSDRSATLDAAVARKSQGLRGLPQHDYSIANIYDKAGFPWHADDKVDQQTQEAQEKYQDETIPEVRRRGLKRKVISIHDDSDQDDDEEIVVQTPQKSIKVEHFPGEPAPVETVEDRRPVVAGGDGNDAVAASRKRMKLEMEMQDIELARRKNALEMAAVDLDQRAHRVKYELDKLG